MSRRRSYHHAQHCRPRREGDSRSTVFITRGNPPRLLTTICIRRQCLMRRVAMFAAAASSISSAYESGHVGTLVENKPNERKGKRTCARHCRFTYYSAYRPSQHVPIFICTWARRFFGRRAPLSVLVVSTNPDSLCTCSRTV